jgi:septum formation protein
MQLSQTRPLLLASGSPRRREILTNLRLPLVLGKADVDESIAHGEGPAEYLQRIVHAKLRAACKLWADAESQSLGDTLRELDASLYAGAVLVADTSVIDGMAILGKPTSRDDAEGMIARLAGRTHEVWTRFAIGGPNKRAELLHEETVQTRVTFRALTAKRVREYAASGEGDDKAGAYAVQGLGAALVSRIEGSYTNVVGLPACEVVVALESLGLLP